MHHLDMDPGWEKQWHKLWGAEGCKSDNLLDIDIFRKIDHSQIVDIEFGGFKGWKYV